MRIPYVLIMFLLLTACDEHFEEKELYGYYAPTLYNNTFDTIQLKPDSVYHRKVYDKNNKLVLDMEGKWEFKDRHRIVFDGFFLNLDRDLVKFPDLVKDTDMAMDTYFETRKGVIGFCVGYFAEIDTNCYRKIKKSTKKSTEI
jgi:hypothetical protein